LEIKRGRGKELKKEKRKSEMNARIVGADQ